MFLLKPYAWLDFEGNAAHCKLSLSDGTKYYERVGSISTDTSDDTVILITIPVVRRTAPSDTTLFEDVLAFSPASSHKKVRIQVVDGSVIKGSVTLRLKNSFFDGPLKPHCWLRMTSVPATEIHVHPYFADGSVMYRVSSVEALVRDPDLHKLIVTCQVTTDPGTSDEVVRNFAGEDMSIFEFVEVVLKEGTTTKGKGTTTQTEADSSSDT